MLALESASGPGGVDAAAEGPVRSDAPTPSSAAAAPPEEIDILDRQERLDATTNLGLDRLYGNLMAGSENHLRAFARNPKNQTAQAYAP